MTQSSLHKTQELLWHLIVAPTGVTEGLRALPTGLLPKNDLGEVVLPNSRLSSIARMDIYASMYFFRMYDCLAQDFSACLAAIGPTRFNNLITDYLIRHPSRSWTLNHIGSALPGFISEHPVQREFVFLADLACLEGALAEVFFEHDEKPLQREELAKLTPASWPTLRLRRIRASRLINVNFDVRQTRELSATHTTSDESRLTAPSPRTATILVWRRQNEVYHRYLSPFEKKILEILDEEMNFAAVCERLSATESDMTETLRLMAEALRTLVEESALVVWSASPEKAEC